MNHNSHKELKSLRPPTDIIKEVNFIWSTDLPNPETFIGKKDEGNM